MSSQKEKQCIIYELWQTARTGRISLSLKIGSEVALDAHAASPHLKDVGARVPGLTKQAPADRRYSFVLLKKEVSHA